MVISIRNEQQQQFLYAFDVTAHIFLHKRRARPQVPVCFVCQLCRYRNDMLPLVIRKHIPNLRACHCATMCSSFLFQYIQPCLQIVKWQRSTVCHYTEKTPLLQVLYNLLQIYVFYRTLHRLYCADINNDTWKIRVLTLTLALDRIRSKWIFWPYTSRNLSAQMSRLPYKYMANIFKTSQNWSNRV